MEEDEDFQSDENIETILDEDSFEDQDTMLYNNYINSREANSQYEFSRYPLDDDSLIVIDDDDDEDDGDDGGNDSSNDDSNSSLGDSGKNVILRKKLNASTSIKIPAKKLVTTDDNNDVTEIEIFDQQVPIKRHILPAVVNTSKNANLSIRKEKKDILNIEKIAIPKKISYVTKLSPVNSSKNKSSISIIPSTAHIEPTNTISMSRPKSSFSNISCKKKISKPNTTPIDESKSEVYVLSQNGENYFRRNDVSKEFKNQPLKSHPAVSSTVKANNKAVESSKQKKKIIVATTKILPSGDTNRISKFVARIQKQPDGKYKMIPAQGKVPIGLEKLFNPNTHFVKQKTISGSNTNEYSYNNFIHVVKPSTSTNQMAKLNEIENFNQNRRVLSGKSLQADLPKSMNFGNVRRNNKLIPHTATSEVAIENHKNINAGNSETILKTNRNLSTSSEFIQLSSNSKSFVESDNQQLINTKYDSLQKSKTKLNANNEEKINLFTQSIHNFDDENSSETTTLTEKAFKIFPSDKHKSNDLNSNKEFEKHSNKHKMMLKEINREEQNDISEEEDNDRYGQFVCCAYKYCDTLVHEPELISNLYCSLGCKQLDTKNVATEEPKEITKPSKKPVIDRKELLEKLGNRIHKRKQSLTSTNNSEKKLKVDEWDEFDQQQEDTRTEFPLDENQSPLNSSHSINSPEVDNNEDEDDDDENLFLLDFKSYINDEKILLYMEEMQFKSAPLKLFDKPFPLEKNYFKVGQKLEGIDPEHEALFCVMTVAEVCGYRIKLHFDGYPKEYDFWVNADSPDLFYPRWCEQNSRIVQPPKDYEKIFDWTDYLKECHAFPAYYFASTKNLANCKKHKFTIGAKLEALDKLTRTLPKQLICVATVADILGNRIRIHFDGWTDDFDYWTDITSTNIHPIRWCENNGRNLSPPSGYNDYKGKRPFSWTTYLQETNSNPVPEDAFVRRPLRDFAIDMTIEVVDLVVPSLIRIAKVVDVRGDELKILYDGFHSNYAYWVEDDSPDIHPVGWSIKTKHPIELPSNKDKIWSCKVLGCNGKGNSNSLSFNHFDPTNCPYELDSWKKAVAGLAKLPDRFKVFGVPIITKVPSLKSQSMESHDDAKKIKSLLKTNVQDTIMKDIEIISDNRSKELPGTKKIKLDSTVQSLLAKQSALCKDSIKFRKHLGLSLLGHDLGSLSYSFESRSWTRYNAQLSIPLCNIGDIRKWTALEVASYVNRVVTANSNRITAEQISISDRFIDQEIDGETFLMLTQEELLNIFKIPLGIALKLINAIILLRQRISAFDEYETMVQ